MTHDTIRRKKDVKAVSGKVQVPPLLRQRHNAALFLFCKSSFRPRSNLSLRPWSMAYLRYKNDFKAEFLSHSLSFKAYKT